MVMSDEMQKPMGTGTLNDLEPAPVKNDLPEIWPMLIRELTLRERSEGMIGGIIINAVITDAQERHEQGVAKYGVGLQPFNGRDALKDAYQESLDMLAYTRQLSWENACNDDPGAIVELMDVAINSVLAYRTVIYARDGK